MKNSVSVKALLREVRCSEFVNACQMPLGYTDSYPMINRVNDKVYLVIPFLRFKVTGEVDKTLVYPIRYTVTAELPTGRIVSFQDLGADSRFRKVDFNKPIGLFRHDAIKDLTKQEFAAVKEELYGAYDAVLAGLLAGQEPAEEAVNTMAALLSRLAEPCQKPIYQALDSNFAAKFLG